MNVSNKEWFCHQCSLQFDSKQIHSLHLKLLHKQKNVKRSNKNVLKSNELISSDDKLDSSNQIPSNQDEKKIFECESCQYYHSQKVNLNVHIAPVHERKKPFKCEFCNNTYSRKNILNQHIASIPENQSFKCNICNYNCCFKSNLNRNIACSLKIILKKMLSQFMKEREYSNVSYIKDVSRYGRLTHTDFC